MDLLLLGLGLGFAAGVSPGPLSTLVVATALQRGLAAGLRVSLAPLLSDLPIIVLALAVLRELPAGLLRGLTLLGGLFVLYLGVDTLRTARRPDRAGSGAADEVSQASPRRDLTRGALVNLLNPHPWIFWVAVGGPLMVEAWPSRPWAVTAFVAGMYLMLVGSKMVLAWIAARGSSYLSATWYRRLLTACGLLLLGMAALLGWHAVWSG